MCVCLIITCCFKCVNETLQCLQHELRLCIRKVTFWTFCWWRQRSIVQRWLPLMMSAFCCCVCVCYCSILSCLVYNLAMFSDARTLRIPTSFLYSRRRWIAACQGTYVQLWYQVSVRVGGVIELYCSHHSPLYLNKNICAPHRSAWHTQSSPLRRT